ncbi:MAG: ATP-binding protein [Ignavibacteria bacterium]
MATLENTRLNLHSNLSNMDTFSTMVDIRKQVSKVANILNDDHLTPGIIVMNGNEFHGMISRQFFFECMSQPFSLALYLSRTVDFLYETTSIPQALILNDSVSIIEATMLALQRPANLIYEPVIVWSYNKGYKLVDIHQLLLAQSKIHLLTVDSLREANEFKSEVLSIASHDLKNPLNSIMGFSQLIKNESVTGNTVSDDNIINECADMIYSSSQRMLELIIKLLDSSAIEASITKLDKTRIDFIELVEDVINANTELANRKKQIILINNQTEKRVVIEADPVRLRSAIDNLTSNAIKYSPSNTSIEINIKIQNSIIQLGIADKGPGIKEEEKSRLFGKFVKLSARPTGGESSTGLGLYIAKQTMLLHGGDIKVETSLGKGSTFIIELPVNSNATAVKVLPGMFDSMIFQGSRA